MVTINFTEIVESVVCFGTYTLKCEILLDWEYNKLYILLSKM